MYNFLGVYWYSFHFIYDKYEVRAIGELALCVIQLNDNLRIWTLLHLTFRSQLYFFHETNCQRWIYFFLNTAQLYNPDFFPCYQWSFHPMFTARKYTCLKKFTIFKICISTVSIINNKTMLHVLRKNSRFYKENKQDKCLWEFIYLVEPKYI